MKFYITLFAVTLFCNSLWSQSEEDFDSFGRLVFNKLIAGEEYNTVDLMWLSHYRTFLGQQDFGEERLEREIHRVNSNYEDMYREYRDSYRQLREYYRKAREKGAEMEYLETVYIPLEGYKNAYLVEMSFIYNSLNVRNEVRISFEAAWYDNFFRLLGPFKENF